MMKNLIVTCLSALLIFNFSACSSNDEIVNTPINNKELCVGTEEFITNIKSIVSSSPTRSVGDEEAMLPQLIENSIKFLNENNLSYADFCKDENDPRIAVIAIGIAEYNLSQKSQTRTTIGGCLLQSLGLKGVGEQSVKAITKQIGKAVLKKAAPYVGWGLFAVEMAMCIAE